MFEAKEQVKSGARTLRVQTWSCERGRVVFARETLSVVRITLSGALDAVVSKNVIAALEQVLSGVGPFHLFWDALELQTYDSSLRVEATRAMLARRTSVGAIAALTGSRVVRMGLTIGNLALGNRIRGFEERAPFEAYFKEVVGRG